MPGSPLAGRWIPGGQAEGPLVGGWLPALAGMALDGSLPPTDGVVLFWEDVFLDEAGAAEAEQALRTLAAYGALRGIAALAVGRIHPQDQPAGFDVAEMIHRVLNPMYPVVVDLDFGHTNPVFTLPMGMAARLDADAATFEILEAATV